MTLLVASFSTEWLTEMTVLRGGFDAKGNPLPQSSHTIGPCLVGWRGTEDPVDRSDLTSDTAVAYCDDPVADIVAGDRVTIPGGAWPSGEFWVDGSAKPWQMGLEIPLRRGS